MASSDVFSAERNWNRLGLAGFTSSGPVRFSRQYVRFSQTVSARGLTCWTEPMPREMSDEEFLQGAEADGHFAFLDDPSEDVYTWDDGDEL